MILIVRKEQNAWKLVPQIRIYIKYFFERFEKGNVFRSLKRSALEILQKDTKFRIDFSKHKCRRSSLFFWSAIF